MAEKAGDYQCPATFLSSCPHRASPTPVRQPSEPPIHLAIQRDGSGGFFIRITGAPDVTCRLQRAASVTGTWSDLATNTVPASGLIEYHETNPPPGQAFYRTVQP